MTTLLTAGCVPHHIQRRLHLFPSQDLSDGDVLRICTFVISYVLVVANFVLSWFLDSAPSFCSEDECDKAPLTNEESSELLKRQDSAANEKKKHPRSPELATTFLSKITFWWFTGYGCDFIGVLVCRNVAIDVLAA